MIKLDAEVNGHGSELGIESLSNEQVVSAFVQMCMKDNESVELIMKQSLVLKP